MGGHAEPRDFLHLQIDVGVEQVVGEHAAAGEELAVLVEVLERHVERMAHRRDVLRFFGLEIVQIFVRRVARVDLVLDAVEAGHHHRRECEVRIRGRIREAHFDATCLRVRHPGDADRGRTVACRIGEHHRRFEAGHQTLVTVGAGVGERVERLG
ncbi:MAG: hypothetical protein RIR08_381, partial [Pseudomonadota bacterium]